MRDLNAVIDLVDDLLATEQVVPQELVVELLVALPDNERRRWIELLMKKARAVTPCD